jgi:hypothetical protein
MEDVRFTIAGSGAFSIFESATGPVSFPANGIPLSESPPESSSTTSSSLLAPSL